MNTETFGAKRFKKETSIVAREIAHEFILVPIRRKTSDIDGFYTLNEVGARVWQLIDGQKTVQEIRDALLLEYEVGTAEAEKDIEELIRRLELVGAVREI